MRYHNSKGELTEIKIVEYHSATFDKVDGVKIKTNLSQLNLEDQTIGQSKPFRSQKGPVVLL